MSKEEDLENKISMKFIQILNRHLPIKRKSLKELLSEDKPYIRNKDGSIHSFDMKELEIIASIVSEWDHHKLKLPIYLEMSSSMERGAIRISGKIETKVISSILYEHEEKITKDEKDNLIIYYPHLPKIRRKLSTTTQFMFTM